MYRGSVLVVALAACANAGTPARQAPAAPHAPPGPAAAPAGPATPAAGPPAGRPAPPTPAAADPEAIARDVVGKLVAHDYAAVAARFDDKMLAALPAD
jgi:hypothetical protein